MNTWRGWDKIQNITKIDTELISKIAAGEVVERPLNIVKELIENSIDASSTEITVTIEKGGIESISVKDNGFGIDSTQVKLAFDLHTTSKLSSHNLETIPTLGFRGEALASISSISYVSIRIFVI